MLVVLEHELGHFVALAVQGRLVYDPPALFVQRRTHTESRCCSPQTSRPSSNSVTEQQRLVPQATLLSQLTSRQSVEPAGRIVEEAWLGRACCPRRCQRLDGVQQAILRRPVLILTPVRASGSVLIFSLSPGDCRLFLGFQPEEGLAVASARVVVERRWPLQVISASVRLTKFLRHGEFSEG